MPLYDASVLYDADITYDEPGTVAVVPSGGSRGPSAATLADVLALASHTAVSRLTALWPDGSERQSFDVASRPGAVVSDGSVDADLRRDVRRSASLTITNFDGSLTPATATDLFAVGARCRVERGAAIPGGQPMFSTLINGFVTGCDPDMNGYIGLTVESHMSALAQDMGEALTIPRGTFLVDALWSLWSPVLPWVQWSVSEAAQERAVGADIPVLGSDARLDVGLKLARDLGCVAYDDRDGRIVVRVRPDPTTQAVTRVMADPLTLGRSIGSRPFNAQPVEVTPTEGEPFYVVAELDDPASPYHRDRVGLRMAPTIRSDSIPDAPTARDMAAKVLAARVLRQDSLSVTNLPIHLDLDEGDVVERTEALSRTAGRYLIETITYPVAMGSITTTESSVVPLYLSDASS